MPVEEIRLPHPPLDEQHEIVSEKTTWRLAQRPAQQRRTCFQVLDELAFQLRSAPDLRDFTE